MLATMNLELVKFGAGIARPSVPKHPPPGVVGLHPSVVTPLVQLIGVQPAPEIVPGATYFSKMATFVADRPGVALMAANPATVGEQTAGGMAHAPTGSYS